MYLVRRISYGLWASNDGFKSGELPADRIGKELRTSKNALSLWRASGSERDSVGPAVDALIFSLSTLVALDVAWIDEAGLTADGVELDPTPGETKLADSVGLHVDAVRLDVSRLAVVARSLSVAVASKDRVWRLTEAEVVERAARVVRDRRVRVANLPQEWRTRLGPHLDA